MRYNSTLDEADEADAVEASFPLIHTGDDLIGWMRAEVWQGMQQILVEQGILEKPVDLNQVYTMEFLQQMYGDEGR